MRSEMLRLSTSGSPVGRTLVLLGGLTFGTVGAALLVGGRPDPRALIGVPLLLLGLLAAALAMRSAVWLGGTEVRVRGVVGTRTVDLATADITATFAAEAYDTHPYVDGAPRATSFVACRPGTRHCVVIPVQTPAASLLPPRELRALAAAMADGRPAGSRHRGAHALAAQLRAVADLMERG